LGTRKTSGVLIDPAFYGTKLARRNIGGL